MFTKALPKLRAHSVHATVDGLKDCLKHVCSWASESRCAFRGHDQLVHFTSGRMFLRCATCGHETPGWQIDPPGYHAWSAPTAAATRPRAVAPLRAAA